MIDSSGRRRQAALAGHTGDAETARRLAGDGDPAVRGTALGALERLGVLDPTLIETALTHDDAGLRARACRLAARYPSVDLAPLLGDPEPLVAEAAAWALGEQEDPRAVDALVSMASDHPDALCREAAVAALGAIGDRRGLAAILAALGDKATVRRRAVIALAPFEGPEVDAALARARADRDWQVRQAAEDLSALDDPEGD